MSPRLDGIGATAAKEYSLEKALKKMKSEWEGVNFEFIAYRDTVSTHSGAGQQQVSVHVGLVSLSCGGVF